MQKNEETQFVDPVKIFFWNMDSKQPIDDKEINVTFVNVGDGEYQYKPVYPIACGVNVTGFQVLPGIKQEKGGE